MAEYISRDWLLTHTNTGMDTIQMMQTMIDAPAADVVEVRHAYWRDILPPDQDNNVQCWCSACGAGELHADGMIVPYCWKCGARMDGGADK